jgi:hypothetical protein
MSGLIWAGIGKGIADAGTTFGSYMLKDIEDQRRREEEDRREANAIKRAEEAERIRAEREEKKAEALKQRVTTETAQVEQRATQMGTERRTARMDSDATRLGEMSAKAGEQGDIALSKEQMLDLIRKDPALRESYRKSGLIEGAPESTRDSRIIAAEDRVTAAMGIGAHSSVLDAFTKVKADTLREVAEENREKQRSAAQAATDRRLDLIEEGNRQRAAEGSRRGDQTDRRLSIMEADARTRERRAERSASPSDPNKKPATTADIQRQINASKDDIALTLGVTKNEVNASLASLRKRADAGDAKAKTRLEEIQPFLNELTELNAAMKQFKRPAGAESANAPAAAPTAPAPSDAKSPPQIAQVQGAPAGSSIGALVSGRGWEVKDKSGKVIGYVGK